MRNKFFSEEQNFFAPWLYILFAVLVILTAYPFFVDTTENEASYVSVVLILAVICLFVWMRLKTQIDEQGILIRFMPFIRQKLIAWQDVQEAYVRKYSALEYGGWGYRVSFGGVAYTTKGKYGLQLVLKNGKKILVGTQKPEEVMLVINEILNDRNA